MRTFASRLLGFIGRRRIDPRLDEEVQTHLDLLAADYERRGLSPVEARYAARRAFGGVEPMKERYRDGRGLPGLEDLMRDARYAVRGLRRNPGFTVVALLTLALGIGANTAIFSIVNSLLLRSLPVRDPARLAILGDANRESPAWSYALWEQIRGRRELAAGVFAWSTDQFTLTVAHETTTVDGLWASGEMFDVLGVPPHLGRTFSPADDVRGGGPDGPVAVISHDLWQRHFGGVPDAIGKSLLVDSVPFTVIGVTPPRFFGPDVGRRFDVALPIAAEPLVRGSNSSVNRAGRFWLRIMVRQRAGQTFEQGSAIFRGVQPQIVESVVAAGLPRQLAEIIRSPFTLTPAARGRSTLRDQYRRPMLILMAAVWAVLLVACVNIASLLLARASNRRPEMSVRLALGASRMRLSRLLLTEAAVLSAVGAALGLLLSRWMSGVLVQQLSNDGAFVFFDLTPDSSVLGFTMLMAIATTVLFGTGPAWQASRTDAGRILSEQGRGSAGGRRTAFGVTLLTLQVALSLTLVVSAALFIRTFASLAFRELGFNKERVLLVTVNPPANRYAPAQLEGLYDRVLRAVSAVPGVERAALSDLTPIGGSSGMTGVQLPGGAAAGPAQMVATNVIGPGWLETYGIRMLAGRAIDVDDHAGAPPVSIVNETFTTQFLGGRNPVGAVVHLGVGGNTQPVEIVGLVQDSVYESLREPAPPTVYTAASQRAAPRASLNVSIRAAHDAPATLTPAIATAIGTVDPNLLLRFKTLEAQVDAALRPERLMAMVSGFFGAVSLLLAGCGLYGVTSYAVGRRRGEIGLRLALGAKRAGVIRLVMRGVAVPVIAGIAAGAVLSLWSSRFVRALLWELEPHDPATFATAAVLLAAVAVVASWLPAWRASRINPAAALRQ